MNGEDLMESIRTRIKLAELNFHDLECKKCIGTSIQKKRKCKILTGWYFGCNKREKYLKESTKESNQKDFREFMENNFP